MTTSATSAAATTADKAWEKAAACEAHARASSDQVMQAKFRKLRDSWIRIGNQAQLRGPVAAYALRGDRAAAA
jgi:hypothetical protein